MVRSSHFEHESCLTDTGFPEVRWVINGYLEIWPAKNSGNTKKITNSLIIICWNKICLYKLFIIQFTLFSSMQCFATVAEFLLFPHLLTKECCASQLPSCTSSEHVVRSSECTSITISRIWDSVRSSLNKCVGSWIASTKSPQHKTGKPGRR